MSDATRYDPDAEERARLLEEVEQAIGRKMRRPGDIDRNDWALKGGITPQTAADDLDRLTAEGKLDTEIVYDPVAKMSKRVWRRKETACPLVTSGEDANR